MVGRGVRAATRTQAGRRRGRARRGGSRERAAEDDDEAAARAVGDGLRVPGPDLVPARARPADAWSGSRSCYPALLPALREPSRASASCWSARSARARSSLGAAGRQLPGRRAGRGRGPAGAVRAQRRRTTCGAPTASRTAPTSSSTAPTGRRRDEVAAFEELVGSHGGMGGEQSHPFVLSPSDWAMPERADRRRRGDAPAACGAGSPTSATRPSRTGAREGRPPSRAPRTAGPEVCASPRTRPAR